MVFGTEGLVIGGRDRKVTFCYYYKLQEREKNLYLMFCGAFADDDKWQLQAYAGP
jgi:hypothetical protein